MEALAKKITAPKKQLKIETSDLFEVFNDDEGRLRLQLIQGKMFVHYTSYEFSHNIYKRTLDKFSMVCDMLKGQGIKELYTCVLLDPLTEKFQEMFGFIEIGRNEHCVLYRKEI
jgi:hypothetical protein